MFLSKSLAIRVPGLWNAAVTAIALLVGLTLYAEMAFAAPWETVVKPTKKPASPTLSVLLVGNSHVLMPGFLKRLKRQLRAKMQRGQQLQLRSIAKIGTTLTKSRKQKETLKILRSTPWNVIVLQESTTAFMTGYGRRGFMLTVKWFRENKPKPSKLLLWEAWPQDRGHALYSGRGVWGKWFKKPPKSPKQLYSWINTVSTKTALANMAGIAPIGGCWMRLPRKKRPYSRDRYHASVRGLTFVAKVLASSIVATAHGQKDDKAGVVGACP